MPPFEDGALQAGVNYRYESGSSDRLFIADTMGGGVGLFDYDNDGWLDIYFVNGCAIPVDAKDAPRPNRLYRNQGDGTFRDVTAQARRGRTAATGWAVRPATTTTMAILICWLPACTRRFSIEIAATGHSRT